MPPDILGIGITGTSLTDFERRILREQSPYAVVLFKRNVSDAPQLRELIREIKAVATRPPLLMIDEEGGRVDRLRHLIPGLPSAEAFGEGARPKEFAAWAGRVIGLALRWFDIEADLAPVADIRGEVSPKGLERRTFGNDAGSVVELAGAFAQSLHDTGVASCLKHFPGIGLGTADPHYGATVIDLPLDALRRRDLIPFERLGSLSGAVMIGHGAYPELDAPDLPATLSRKIATGLLRDTMSFNGLAMTDDMEMHAVSDLGSYEQVSERALMAGNDVILYCSNVERIPSLQRHLASRASATSDARARFDEAVARGERYRAHCARLRAAAPPPLATFDEVLDEAAQLVEALEGARTRVGTGVSDSSSTTGTGRTGREEWT